ncbi:acetyl-CoA C-acetyltransferase [Chloroflexota bacterium]
MREVVIVSGQRTAIANFGGALKDVPATRLGAAAIKGALKKVGLKPEVTPEIAALAPEALKGTGLTELEGKYQDWDGDAKGVAIDEVIMGNVVQAGQGQNPGRQACIQAGVPKETPAFTVNKVCASGMKAVALATQAIRCGDAEVVVAGGMENMSSIPYYFPKARWGARMFNAEVVDGMVHDGLWECFYGYHMGVTSENIAEKYGISRAEQDEFSLESNNRAVAAIKNGTFKDEIVPVEVKVKRDTVPFETDEHPRETSMEALGRLASVFKKDGTVTAGNASAITDAAAALVLMSADKAKELGCEPLAYVRAFASGGVDPAYMGLGVVPSVKKALQMADLSLGDMDCIELNEAFAAQSLGVVRELGIDLAKTNLHGGGISLGHPIGCTGARIIVTLAHEMARRNLKYGLATLCIGGGMGMSTIIERK